MLICYNKQWEYVNLLQQEVRVSQFVAKRSESKSICCNQKLEYVNLLQQAVRVS